MKLIEIYGELLDLTKRLGIIIRKEKGSFNSGFCKLNEEKIIIFNRSTTLETKTALLARCLNSISVEDMYIKPAVRDFIEKEKESSSKQNDLVLQVDYVS